MSKAGKISVDNGVVLVDPSFYDWTLLGASCPTSLRAGTTIKQPFKFFPNKDGKGDLILMGAKFTKDEPEPVLFHITHGDGGKIWATDKPKSVAETVSPGVNYQVVGTSIEVVVGNTRFTSSQNELAGEDEAVMIVDATSILKFIAGRIKIGELKAAAKRAQKRSGLERQLKDVKGQLAESQQTVRTLVREKSALEASMRSLANQATRQVA